MNLVFCSFPFCLGYGSFISWNAATTCLHTATYWTKFNPHQPLITMTLTYVLFNPIILIRHALCSVRIYSNRTTWYALSVSSFKFSVYLSMPSMKMSHGLWPAWVKGYIYFVAEILNPWPHVPAEPSLCQNPFRGPARMFYTALCCLILAEIEWTIGHPSKPFLFEIMSCNVSVTRSLHQVTFTSCTSTFYDITGFVTSQVL